MKGQVKQIATSWVAAILSVNTLVAPALAFRSSTGAISGANKLQEGIGSGGSDDLSFSPLLLELAKLIGRTGLPQGFFLKNDSSFPDSQGVDLRTLLLLQAGLIKMPVNIPARKGNPKSETWPTLSVPRIPELAKEINPETRVPQPGDMPSLASEPLPREPENTQVIDVIEAHTNLGDPQKFSIAMPRPDGNQPASSPLLSIDVPRLQSDLDASGQDGDSKHASVHAEIPRLAMLMPRTNSMPFITKNAFRLWTYRLDARSLELRGVAQVDGNATGFNGTFVVASPDSIKCITGRHFEIATGRVLAHNLGGELLFITPFGTISVEPQATIIVELLTLPQGKVVRIYALDGHSAHTTAAAITLPSSKEKPVNLDKGEALIIGDHQLADSDFTGALLSKRSKIKSNMVRGTFPIAQFVSRDPMLKADAHVSEQSRPTLAELKRRLQNE